MFPFGPGAPSASATRNSEPWSLPPAFVLVMSAGSIGATAGPPGAAAPAGRTSATAAGEATGAGAGAGGAGASAGGAGGASAAGATTPKTALERPTLRSWPIAPKTALARPALAGSAFGAGGAAAANAGGAGAGAGVAGAGGSSTTIRSRSSGSVTKPSPAICQGVPTRRGRDDGSSAAISCARSLASTLVGLTGAPLTLPITTRLTPPSEVTEVIPMS